MNGAARRRREESDHPYWWSPDGQSRGHSGGGGSICHVTKAYSPTESCKGTVICGRRTRAPSATAVAVTTDYHRCAVDCGIPVRGLGICGGVPLQQEGVRSGSGYCQPNEATAQKSARLLARVQCNMSQRDSDQWGKGIDPKEMVMLAMEQRTRLCRNQAGDWDRGRVLVPKASPASPRGTWRPSEPRQRSARVSAASHWMAEAAGLWRSGTNAGEIFRRGRILTADVTARYQLNMRYPARTVGPRYPHQQGLQDVSFVDCRIGRRPLHAFNERNMEEFGHYANAEGRIRACGW